MDLILAFTCGLLLDWYWTQCVNAVQAQRPLRAANLAIVLYGCTLVATAMMIQCNIPALIAYGVGNWLGTFTAVRKCKS